MFITGAFSIFRVLGWSGWWRGADTSVDWLSHGRGWRDTKGKTEPHSAVNCSFKNQPWSWTEPVEAKKDSINLMIKATSCSSSLLSLLSKLDKTSDSLRSVLLQDGVNSYFPNLYSKFILLKFCVASSAIKIWSFCWRRIREMIFFPGSEIPVPSLHGFETIPWGRAHRHHHCKGRSECRELQKRSRCFVQHVQRLVVK